MLPNKNEALLRALLNQADTLSCSAAKNEFPVLLQPLAKRRRVTSIEFQPLLVDAMLITHPSGFRILFNSNGDDPAVLSGQFENETRNNPMPTRLRFSLAHELAHTLFYDLTSDTPQVAKQFRSGGGKTALENLERNCNKIAAHLLLPTPMLETAFKSLKSLDPHSLVELARQAGVSIEALVRRMAAQNSLFSKRYFRGCIALVTQRGGEILITALAKRQDLNIARDLRLLRAGERWQLATSAGLQINPSSHPAQSTVMLTMETAQGSKSTQPYYVSIAQVGTFESAASYLITIEQIEGT